MNRAALLLLPLLLAASATARADGFFDVLDRPRPFRIESMRTRFSHVQQMGYGYQSAAGPIRGPGSEELTVEQPQIEIVAKQGERLTHRMWIPLDVVTAASPDAIDATSAASRTNEAGTIDIASTYRVDPQTDVGVRVGFHVEEPYRSWSLGVNAARRVADDNATLSASINQGFDWFDTFSIRGDRLGHANRSSTNGNVALTQLLSPTTVAHVNYGFTGQLGELSNTWNSMPFGDRLRTGEVLPHRRLRHALVGRLAQWLPWRGALHAYYRFYIDDWGIVANTVELELLQRIGPSVYVRGNYRLHQQQGASFYAQHATTSDASTLRTADSDLGSFVAHTVGMLVAIDLRFLRRPSSIVREAHLDFGYDYYWRMTTSPQFLHASIVTCSLGLRFF